MDYGVRTGDWLNNRARPHTQKKCNYILGGINLIRRGGINEEPLTKCFKRQDKNRVDLITTPTSSQ